MIALLVTNLTILVFLLYRVLLLGSIFENLTTIQNGICVLLDKTTRYEDKSNEEFEKFDTLIKKISQCENSKLYENSLNTDQLRAINDHLLLLYQKLDKPKKQKNG